MDDGLFDLAAGIGHILSHKGFPICLVAREIYGLVERDQLKAKIGEALEKPLELEDLNALLAVGHNAEIGRRNAEEIETLAVAFDVVRHNSEVDDVTRFH